ncbi:MAG: hypothetical protein QOD72_1586 [Acidimicrobiaceae bacterium]|nr:hypothetical protein [Acidimicrobiaceae bacterium]
MSYPTKSADRGRTFADPRLLGAKPALTQQYMRAHVLHDRLAVWMSHP